MSMCVTASLLPLCLSPSVSALPQQCEKHSHQAVSQSFSTGTEGARVTV